MNLPVEAIIPLMAKDYPLGDQTVEAYGLNRLVDQSLELLPKMCRAHSSTPKLWARKESAARQSRG